MLAVGLLVPNWPVLGLLLGVVLALVYVRLGRRLRGRNARVWWAAGLVAAAALYVVFALARGDVAGAALEMIGVTLVGVAVRMGLRGDLRWLAAGWLLHPLWDLGVHPPLEAPPLYIWLCLSFDAVVGIALYLQAVRN
ncbi:MAG: hypothetical protein CMM84_16600 [Rhodothermaceae bacterium]|nr:hypothetical protein [Rhodothermaceae bacterium]MBC14654.1 hypothetical protein [Rhodothermaceae bacterium]